MHRICTFRIAKCRLCIVGDHGPRMLEESGFIGWLGERHGLADIYIRGDSPVLYHHHHNINTQNCFLLLLSLGFCLSSRQPWLSRACLLSSEQWCSKPGDRKLLTLRPGRISKTPSSLSNSGTLFSVSLHQNLSLSLSLPLKELLYPLLST